MSMAHPSEFNALIAQSCTVIEVVVQPSLAVPVVACDQEPRVASSLNSAGVNMMPSFSCNDRLRSFGL